MTNVAAAAPAAHTASAARTCGLDLRTVGDNTLDPRGSATCPPHVPEGPSFVSSLIESARRTPGAPIITAALVEFCDPSAAGRSSFSTGLKVANADYCGLIGRPRVTELGPI